MEEEQEEQAVIIFCKDSLSNVTSNSPFCAEEGEENKSHNGHYLLPVIHYSYIHFVPREYPSAAIEKFSVRNLSMNRKYEPIPFLAAEPPVSPKSGLNDHSHSPSVFLYTICQTKEAFGKRPFHAIHGPPPQGLLNAPHQTA